LYQLHEPNDEIPLEETISAMEALVQAGKVRFIGVSNFSVDQLQRAQRALVQNSIASNQVRYSMVDRTIERGLLEYCAAQRITVIAHTPLARGLHHLHDCDPSRVLGELTQKYGRTPAQIALNWCLRRAPVVVIPKSDSALRVLENCGASDWDLTSEDAARLDRDIRFRRRSTMEGVLRRAMPSGFKTAIKRVVERLPASVRRRVV
jgi:diketogulonate reductase-like aldo/keto reductase